jgi:ABC-type transport system substrate-binding protein
MKKRYLAAIIAVFLILLVSASGSIEISAYGPIPSDLNTGPYVDSINFQVISGQDQRILALQAGTIEMDTSIFDPSYYLQLSADPDISVYSGLRNGYGHITINCRDWPLNETVLRRAFAYAFNKTRVTTEIMDGWSVEHDSLVPIVNSWCIEDQFSFHYYYDEAVLANQILNDSGIFEINSETGFRAYHGQSFNIEVEYPSTSPALGGGIAQIGVDALHALHINASICASNYIELISRLDSHGSYDMAFYAQDFHGDNVEWLANEYWSEYADIPMQNPTNFENATYDSYRSQLLNGTTYNEVYNASSMMQKILQEQVPRLVVYENIYNQAYRTDVFTGHIPDINNYITGPWTMRKIHRLDGGLGGTVPISINMEPDCFNIYSISSATSAMILSNL